jgi:hypothetical protein
MRKGEIYHNLVRVVFHLNGGFTRVSLEGLFADIEIPTRVIPLHLRAIGSRFVLVRNTTIPEDVAEINEWRATDWYIVEELVTSSQ